MRGHKNLRTTMIYTSVAPKDMLVLRARKICNGLRKKAAPRRLAFSCLLAGLILSSILYGSGLEGFPSPLASLLSGSFLFGTAFVVTEPVSGPKTNAGQWIYGFFVGELTMILRGYSNFSEGIMFAVLLMNAFVPILDQMVTGAKVPRKASP
ncbi:MAG: RnfABCDGE type electron transport complex subunit D [Deltaproteobacteria bacterium]|nr:RnfABCDGE type electron transport complex subunit D [Deltaproteobacteria bacterium]